LNYIRIEFRTKKLKINIEAFEKRLDEMLEEAKPGLDKIGKTIEDVINVFKSLYKIT